MVVEGVEGPKFGDAVITIVHGRPKVTVQDDSDTILIFQLFKNFKQNCAKIKKLIQIPQLTQTLAILQADLIMMKMLK